jgi:hypothetical protein
MPTLMLDALACADIALLVPFDSPNQVFDTQFQFEVRLYPYY